MVVCDKGFKKVFLQPRRARGNFKANVAEVRFAMLALKLSTKIQQKEGEIVS